MKIKDFFQKNEDYQSVIQSVTDYMIAINWNYKIIMANDLFKNEFDIRIGDFCYSAWKNRDKKCKDCLVDKSFKDGNVHWREEEVVMKDGRIAQMLVKTTPIKNGKGHISYVMETATDTSEKKHLEEMLIKATGNLEKMAAERIRGLQKYEKRYRTIFERSNDAVILTDSDGKIIEVNIAGIRMLGYKTKEDLFALESAVELFENRKDLHVFLKKVSREGFIIDFESRLLGKQGQAFDALVKSNIIFDVTGQVSGYVMIIKDVTLTKQAQEKIRRQNIRLTALNNISTTVSSTLELSKILETTINMIVEILGTNSARIYLLDDKRQVLNLAAHRGFSAEALANKQIKSRIMGEGLLGLSAQTSKACIVDNLIEAKDPHQENLIAEGIRSVVYLPLISKGKARGVMAVCAYTPFKFSAESIEFLTAIGNQIGMALNNADLYETVKKSYQELKEAQEQIIQVEKLASLGKLAATVAHEINNPLASVLTYTKLIKKIISRDKFQHKRAKDFYRYLATMESETTRCGEIVKNLLAFSRRSKITMKTHSIEEIIDRTLVLVAYDLEMKEIQLIKEIETDLPEIQCDIKQIQQVLLNIISNAAESMTEGGILTVTAKLSEKDGFLKIDISDTGCGIAKKDLKNIFEPFFTSKEEGKGVGLGLSVVYGIITRHNGSIEVESATGEGSTFKILLPTSK